MDQYIIPKETNINDMPPMIFFRLQELLDNGVPTKNWRALIQAMPNPSYSFFQVEQFASLYHSRQSPAEKVLYDLGSRGKTVEHLVSYLRTMEHEEALKLFLTHSPAQITKHPAPQAQISEGDELRLECNATGFPFPHFQWFCENNEVPNAVDKVLVIRNTKVENSGRYCCRIYNGNVSSVRFTDKCLVIVDPKPGFIPRILSEPSDTIVLPNQPVKLSCSAFASPEPRYQWYLNNQPVDGATDPDYFIPKASASFGGVYYCVVTNMFGRCQTRSANLSIENQVSQPCFKATDKVALLIGNSKYTNNSNLDGVPTDIEQLSKMFTELGFKVVALINLSLAEMEFCIEFFCDLLMEGVYGVFYFGGHGFSLQRQTYLMAVDAHHGFKVSDSICAEKVLRDMQAKKPSLIVFILDNCRMEKVEAIKADHEKVVHYKTRNPGNTVFFYATSPGYKAFDCKKNGVMLDHLSQFLPRKDLSVNDVFFKTMNSFGNDKRPDVQRQQYAHVDSNLREMRKFNDPIDYTGHTMCVRESTVRWESALRLPRPLRLNTPVQVQLDFKRIFNNQLKVVTEVKSSNMDLLAYISEIPNTVSCPAAKVESQNSARLCQDIDDLQQLKGSLKVKLTVFNKSTMEPVHVKDIDLGCPLIASLTANSRLNEHSHHCISDQRMSFGQGQLKHVTREPMESSELEVINAADMQRAAFR